MGQFFSSLTVETEFDVALRGLDPAFLLIHGA